MRFQSIPEGCIKTPKAFRKLPQIEALKFGGTRRIVFNRHCLWRLNPSGACALLRRTKRSFGRVCRTAVLIQTYPYKTKKTHLEGGSLILVGPGGLFRARLPRAFSPLRGAAAALWRPKCSRSRILSNRCRRSHPTRPPKNQKAPLSRGSFGFGRTRRINQNAIASRVLTLRVVVASDSMQITPWVVICRPPSALQAS